MPIISVKKKPQAKLGRPTSGKARRMVYSITMEPELIDRVDDLVRRSNMFRSRSMALSYIVKLGLMEHYSNEKGHDWLNQYRQEMLDLQNE